MGVAGGVEKGWHELVLWLPVVMRELREQARRPLNHWLRALGALSLLVVTVQVLQSTSTVPGPRIVMGAGGIMRVWESSGGGILDRIGMAIQAFEGKGAQVFNALNLVLLMTIGLVGPMLTADCLSRERREGTMGLLFLTPLRPGDVVMAKLLAHGFRAALVFLGAMPVLMLPVLLGGLSWLDVARAALLDAGALVIALTAGLWASTRWQGPRAVLLGALGLAAGALFLWLWIWGAAQGVRVWWGGQNTDLLTAIGSSAMGRWQLACQWANRSIVQPELAWMIPMCRPMTGVGQLLMPGVALLLAIGIAGWVYVRATRCVAVAQREGRQPGRSERMEAALTRPVMFRDGLANLRRVVLRWSPQVWTEVRTWRLRVAPWVLLLVVAIVETWSLSSAVSLRVGDGRISWAVLMILAVFLGASSFQRDRGSGALELALTVPDGVSLLVRGRLVAMVLQVLPAVLFVLGVEGWMSGVHWMESRDTRVTLWRVVPEMSGRMLIALSVGAYFSLRCRGFVAAFVASLATVGVLSVVCALFARLCLATTGGWYPYEGPGAGWLIGVSSGLIAMAFLSLLRGVLTRRSYSGA